MKQTNPRRQFYIQDLFVVMFLVAALLAGVAEETMFVASATIFCCVSWIILAVAIWWSASHFFRQLGYATRARNFRYFIGRRIKWTFVDVSILAWFTVAIATANFVLENYVAGGKITIFLGVALSPLIATLFFQRFKAWAV